MKNKILPILATLFFLITTQSLVCMNLKISQKRSLDETHNTQLKKVKIEEIFSQHAPSHTEEPSLLFNTEPHILHMYKQDITLDTSQGIAPHALNKIIVNHYTQRMAFIATTLSRVAKDNLTCYACNTRITTGLELDLFLHQNHECPNLFSQALCCFLCDKHKASKVSSLRTHILHHCPKNDNKEVFPCTYCTEIFTAKHHLTNHMTYQCIDNKNRVILTCDICKKNNFSSPSSLKKHACKKQ